MATQRIDTFNQTGKAAANAVVYALRSQGIEARIDTTYRDYGQNWLWETVIVGATDNNSSYQALNPSQFEAMNDGCFDYSEVNEIVKTAIKLSK